jgi:hypothetical protein
MCILNSRIEKLLIRQRIKLGRVSATGECRDIFQKEEAQVFALIAEAKDTPFGNVSHLLQVTV